MITALSRVVLNALVFLIVNAVPNLVIPKYISQIPVTTLMALERKLARRMIKSPIVMDEMPLMSVVPSSTPNCFF